MRRVNWYFEWLFRYVLLQFINNHQLVINLFTYLMLQIIIMTSGRGHQMLELVFNSDNKKKKIIADDDKQLPDQENCQLNIQECSGGTSTMIDETQFVYGLPEFYNEEFDTVVVTEIVPENLDILQAENHPKILNSLDYLCDISETGHPSPRPSMPIDCLFGTIKTVDIRAGTSQSGCDSLALPRLVDYSSSDLDVLDDTTTSIFDKENINSTSDHTYSPSTYDNITSSTTTSESEKESPQFSEQLSKKKRGRPQIKEWSRQRAQLARMKGEEYLGYRNAKITNIKFSHDKKRSSRKMLPTCNSKFCKNSSKRNCESFSEDRRKKIFANFWRMSWDEKRVYVINLVTCRAKNRETVLNESCRRGNSHEYYLYRKSIRLQICKNMFLGTLGLREWMVQNWIKKSDFGIPRERVANSTENSRNSIGKERRMHLSQWFDGLPKLPSHYCRKESSKMYLEGEFKSLSEVYHLYKTKCFDENTLPVSISLFNKIFHDKNISIFRPRKDQCDLCFSHKMGQVDENIYKTHIIDKDRARSEKDSDKKKSLAGSCNVLTMDMQAVHLCPKLQASALYYSMKLKCHNFTIFNLATAQCSNYWWHECEGDVTAPCFASIIISYLKSHCLHKKLPIIIYSDGCGYQNRNSILSNALLNFAVQNQVRIEQKFLIKGHTQMECDSVHSTIERKIKNREVYLPSDYARLTKEARIRPFPYEALNIQHDFFLNYAEKKLLFYDSIRPGRFKNDPEVKDLRALLYDPAKEEILFKLSFDDNYSTLPRRPKHNQFYLENIIPKLYNKQIELTLSKFTDLQKLKKVLPEDTHHFYNNLPHSSTLQQRKQSAI